MERFLVSKKQRVSKPKSCLPGEKASVKTPACRLYVWMCLQICQLRVAVFNQSHELRRPVNDMGGATPGCL